MSNKKTRAVVCMTTHNRIDCARINQEVISLNYRNPLPIVHACSHPEYSQHLEAILVSCPPSDLRQGALNLLNTSIRAAREHFQAEYLIHLEGDTWIMDESVIYNIMDAMDQDPKRVLATSAWDNDPLVRAKARRSGWILKGKKILAALVRPLGWPVFIKDKNNTLATQFFVMRNTPQMAGCLQKIEVEGDLNLENTFYSAFMKDFGPGQLLRIKEREPAHPNNRYIAAELSLFSQHWTVKGSAHDPRPPEHILYIPAEMDGKKETLQAFPNIRKGKYLQKLLNAEDVSYYNYGASRQ